MNKPNWEERKKRIKSLPLKGWQVSAAKMFENLDEGEVMTIVSPRQHGKSTLVAQILLFVAVNRNKSVSYYISPTISQSRLFFKNIESIVVSSPFVKSINASLLELTFHNGSRILFRSSEQKDHLRGGTVSGILILDEMCFMPDEILPIVLPFVTFHHANIIAISTPLFKHGEFYNWYSKGVLKVKGYKSLNVSDFDNSFFISEEQKEAYRKIYSDIKFKQEILGQFADLNDGVFGDFTKNLFTPEKILPLYGGIDWSNNGGDDTVLSGFDKDGHQCVLKCFTEISDPVERVKVIGEFINKTTIKYILCESNSMGEVYISLLKKIVRDRKIIPFTTTNSSKKRIVEQLIASLKQDEITLLPDSVQTLELETYQMQELSKGNYTYNGKKDDIVMADCFALECLKMNTNNNYTNRISIL